MSKPAAELERTRTETREDTSGEPKEVARRVIAFYRDRGRDLPWRKTRDPYAIWVSEVMLQQTRVATAERYYARWMERFPTAEALAEAPLDDVLAAWSGLGYYRRARNLHRGAREVVARYGGTVPTSVDGLRALPGVGRYTAGAIASIAFGQPAPIVDGNVARVLARLDALDGDIKAPATSRKLWSRAADLVPTDDPGAFNQGLMELGATLCAPSRPDCGACPLADLCRARAEGLEHELPRVPPRKRESELPVVETSAAWIERGAHVALAKRPAEGLFGGLWELPQASGNSAALADLLGEAAHLGAREPVARHRQTLTHRRLSIDVYATDLRAELTALASRLAPRYEGVAWHPIETLETYGIAASTRAIRRLYWEQAGWNPSEKPSATSKRGMKKSSKAFASSATSPRPTKTSPEPPAARRKASTS